MGVVRAGWLVIAITAINCSPAPRDGADATPPDAATLCGNGRRDVLPTGETEGCDEGAQNGTPQGRCTKQCWPAEGPLRPATFHVDLGPPIAGAAQLFLGGGFSVATFSHDDGLVRVWQQAPTGPGPNPRLLQVAAPVVSLASIAVYQGPAWIEQAAGESPHLYVADYAASDPPTIRELPYPFPEGLQPELVGHTVEDLGLVIVDRSPAGELLVAMVIPRSPTDIVTFRQRFAAPAGARGITVDTNTYSNIDDGRSGSRQLVVFFDDPGSFVSIDVRFTQYPDPLATAGTVELTERTRGPWPFHVVSGDLYPKSCPGLGSSVVPWALSVLTDSGDIFLWKFDHGLAAGEVFPRPFAHVSAGTRASRHGFGANSVSVLQPDGTELLFSDGDPCDMDSVALAPSSAAVTVPSPAVMLPPGGTGSPIRAIAGGVLYW